MIELFSDDDILNAEFKALFKSGLLTRTVDCLQYASTKEEFNGRPKALRSTVSFAKQTTEGVRMDDIFKSVSNEVAEKSM